MLFLSIYSVLLLALLTNASTYNTVRIYSNLAEVIAPLENLPLVFTQEDWNHIRGDSITLFGEHVNITSQTISEKKESLNGSTVYIRSPVSSDQIGIKLIPATLIDEKTQLVRVEDDSIVDDQSLYFTVPDNQLYYPKEPSKKTFTVDFTYTNPSHSPVFVSYLQSHLNWQTQYQLHLDDHTSELTTMANIRNDAETPVSMEHAELIGGEVNLQMPGARDGQQTYRDPAILEWRGTSKAANMMMEAVQAAPPTVGQGGELIGLYVFPINSSMTIAAKTNYLLPMFRPHVTVQRYAHISKSFSAQSSTGKAQRSYRLRSDQYLSRGNCIVREQDRIVGETHLPNLAAKDKYEFSVGEDANVVFKENVTLISSTSFNETEHVPKGSSSTRTNPPVVTLHTRSVYEVNLHIKNFKSRPMDIEYEQSGFYQYRSFRMPKDNQTRFVQDGTSIKSTMTVNGNDEQAFTYTVEVVS